MKTLAIIGTVGLPPKFGGFETLADFLVKKLPTKYDITVFCSSKNFKEREKKYYSANKYFIPLRANGLQSIPYDIYSIFIALFRSDTLLILGISGCIILPIIKPFHKKRIAVSIDGMEWKRDKWSKIAKWFLKFSEKCAVKSADVIVADNIIIKKYIKTTYNTESELIEYGGDQSVYIKPSLKDIKKFPFLKNKYALSLSRIEPENNCRLILDTFSKSSDIQLVYIGNWNNNKYGKALKEKYLSHKNIILLDAIHDIDVLNLVRSNCAIYVHGHSVGGTNPALVEAMYVGLPIIAYDVDFNRETTQNKALFFNDAIQLQNNLNLLDNNISLRNKFVRDVKKIANNKYNWDNIINKYNNIL